MEASAPQSLWEKIRSAFVSTEEPPKVEGRTTLVAQAANVVKKLTSATILPGGSPTGAAIQNISTSAASGIKAGFSKITLILGLIIVFVIYRELRRL